MALFKKSGGRGPFEPILLRSAIFNTLEDHLYPFRDGAATSFDRLTVLILATPERPPLILRDFFVTNRASTVDRGWVRQLRAAGLDRFLHLPIDYDVVEELPDALSRVARQAIDQYGFAVLDRRPAAAPGVLTLIVADPSRIEGDQALFTVRPGETFNIGRMRTAIDEEGRFVRTNHIAFLDRPELRPISRRQAHIRYNPEARTFELFEDRAANRTQVIRSAENRTIPVVRPLPVTLHDGDEIFLNPSVRIACRLGSDDSGA